MTAATRMDMNDLCDRLMTRLPLHCSGSFSESGCTWRDACEHGVCIECDAAECLPGTDFCADCTEVDEYDEYDAAEDAEIAKADAAKEQALS